MPEKYIPKLKTGQTAEANGNGEGTDHIGYQVIIIGTRKDLCETSNFLVMSDNYDNSCPENTLYATYNPDTNRTWWYWENDLDLICTNSNRGKKQLREVIGYIFESFGISSLEKEKFLNKFLKLEEEKSKKLKISSRDIICSKPATEPRKNLHGRRARAIIRWR